MNKMAVRFTLWRPQLPAARPAELAVNDRLNPTNPLENAKSFNYNFWNIRGFDEYHFTLKEFANRKVRSLSLFLIRIQAISFSFSHSLSPENIHFWGKYHCTAGLQFYKFGFNFFNT